MAIKFRISNLLVGIAPPDDASRPRTGRLCLITCNDGAHSLVCEPYSTAPIPFRACRAITCIWTGYCDSGSFERAPRAAIQPEDLATLKRDLHDALAELADYEAAVGGREPQTLEEIEAAEKEISQALAALKERKAALSK